MIYQYKCELCGTITEHKLKESERNNLNGNRCDNECNGRIFKIVSTGVSGIEKGKFTSKNNYGLKEG